MKTDAIWQAFAETGDPLCYLLYKAAEDKKPKKGEKEKKEAPGRGPRS